MDVHKLDRLKSGAGKAQIISITDHDDSGRWMSLFTVRLRPLVNQKVPPAAPGPATEPLSQCFDSRDTKVKVELCLCLRIRDRAIAVGDLLSVLFQTWPSALNCRVRCEQLWSASVAVASMLLLFARETERYVHRWPCRGQWFRNALPAVICIKRLPSSFCDWKRLFASMHVRVRIMLSMNCAPTFWFSPVLCLIDVPPLCLQLDSQCLQIAFSTSRIFR